MQPYAADRSIVGKLRRRVARLVTQKPATLSGLRRPLLTISFDDAPVSAARDGAAILKKHGVHGTYFISTGLSGQDSHLGQYTTPEDIQALHAAGHEIACHTHTHIDCGRASVRDIAQELQRNHDALRLMGLPSPRTFAYPYGDVSPGAKGLLHDRYLAARALHHGLVTTGSDLNQVPAVGIEGQCGEQTAFTWLDKAAKTRDAWLILYTHDVCENPSDWGCTPAALDRIIDQARTMGFEIVTFEAGARRAQGLPLAKAA